MRQDRLDLPIVAASLLGIALVLARGATYGVEWFVDGIYYVSVARNVIAGEGLLTFNGVPLTNWPPLIPLVLVFVSGFGIFDPAAVFGPLNIALQGLTVFVVGNYLRQHLESRPLVVWACLAVAISTPLGGVASKTMSEPLFILMTTLALIQTHRLLTHGDKSALFLAAIFSALAWQTRYLGVALPMVIGLFLLFQRGASWPLRAWRLTIYSAVVALPMGLWLLRNYLLAGASLDPWGASAPSLFPTEAIDGVLAWLDVDLPLMPGSDSLAPVLNIVVPLAVASAGLLAVVMRPRGSSPKHPPFDWLPCWLFGAFVITYLAALSIASQAGYWTGFVDRFVAPLWIPIVMAVSFALDWLFRRASTNMRGWPVGDRSVRSRALPRVFVGTLSLPLVLWIVDQAMHNVREIHRENSFTKYAHGLSAPRFLRSETLRYIRENPMHSVVFSNVSEIIYLNNASKSVRYHGTNHRDSRGHLDVALAKMRISNAKEGEYFVWFRDWDSYIHPFGETQLQVTPNLVQVASLADGAIFRVKRGHVPPNPFRQIHHSTVAGMLGRPSARSTFHVYHTGRTLTYVKQPCLPEETDAFFFLHLELAPVDPGTDHLVAEQFNFWEIGTMLDDDICIALVDLPEAPRILYLRTGQLPGYTSLEAWLDNPTGWSAEANWSAEPDPVWQHIVPRT